MKTAALITLITVLIIFGYLIYKLVKEFRETPAEPGKEESIS